MGRLERPGQQWCPYRAALRGAAGAGAGPPGAGGKQQQRDEAFREAERENAALPEEEEKQKKPAGSKAADAAPTELVLPQREARTGSPVRYILIGALLAGALCIAIYLFTHPAREDDPADETKP